MTTWFTPTGPDGQPSTALLTDHYELTALDAARRSGVADHQATFELFGRRLPTGRRYAVVAGMGRAIDAVARFRFGPSEIDFLRERAFVSDDTLDWLADYRFRGTIDGAEVHPREVVRRALAHNAAAVIVGHNHPSGNPEPSAADRAVTARLKQALALVDLRLLDHFVIADGPPVSLAARGWV